MSLSDHRHSPTYCFSVFAAAEASVMPRVLELFAKRGLTPTQVHGVLGGPANADLAIDVQATGLAPDTAAHIARCLRQIVYVERVLTAVKSATPEAEAAEG